MVLLREEFYDELKPLLARWILCYLRAMDIATPACFSNAFQPSNGGQVHVRARGAHPAYPARASVSDEQVAWEHTFAAYSPVEYVHPTVIEGASGVGGRIDPETPMRAIIEARGSYELLKRAEPWAYRNGRPLNPHGRTGVSNRGLLGRWGPNHAADTIVTRHNREKPGAPLEMVVVCRDDTGEWAIPSGMVEPGEAISATLKGWKLDDASARSSSSRLSRRGAPLFTDGAEVYRGCASPVSNGRVLLPPETVCAETPLLPLRQTSTTRATRTTRGWRRW